jgi:excisionase family DNA binding protein
VAEYLTIAQAAAALGVTVDTLRLWERQGRIRAYRTVGRHRRFLEQDVKKLGAALRGPGPPCNPPRPTATGPRCPSPQGDWLPNATAASYWQGRAQDARAKLEALRAREVARGLIQTREAEEARARAHAEATAREQEHQRRLDALKEYGHQLAHQAGLPPEWRAKATADLETYVSPTQFPRSLPEDEAQAFVAARISEIAEEFRAECAQAEQEERQRWERQRAHTRVEQLVAYGMSRAGVVTLLWDSDEQERATRELGRELRAQVRADWTESGVRDLVDDFLEGDDEEDEEDDEDDWDD